MPTLWRRDVWGGTIMEEHYLLAGLKQGNKEAFSLLFTAYYKNLVLFGGNYLPDKMACEDIVQSVFLNLWNDRATLAIETSLKSYLLTAVRNSCLNEIRHRNVMLEHASYTMSNPTLDEINTENYVLYSDLHEHFIAALREIPESYRVAFEMNRMQGLKYKEIATRLNISERVVELRIVKALKLLRLSLKEFLSFLLLLFLK